MYQYPNQGQDDPTQQSQYPNQGTDNTPYGGYSASSNMPPYGDQHSHQSPQPPFQQSGNYQPPFQQGGNYQPSFQQSGDYQPPFQQSGNYQPPFQQSGDYQPPFQQSGNYQPPFQQSGNYQPPFQQSGSYQPPFQQGSYQQGAYQQSPYQQSPYPQSSPISLDYRNIIAGIGAIVAIIAFFLPYYTISFSEISSSNLSESGYGVGGRYWLDWIIALAALAIVLLLQFGEQWFKSSTHPTIQRVIKSLASEPRTWYIRLVAVGGFGIFFHFILDLGRLNIWGIGSWLYLLGMIAVVVAGVLFIKPPTPTTVQPIR